MRVPHEVDVDGRGQRALRGRAQRDVLFVAANRVREEGLVVVRGARDLEEEGRVPANAGDERVLLSGGVHRAVGQEEEAQQEK